MIETQQLLEQDRERIISRLSSAESQEQAASILDDELGRLLIRTGEQRNADPQADAARRALITVRSALPMIDTAGEVKIYERTDTGRPKGTAGKWGLLLAGAACGAAGVLILFISGKNTGGLIALLALILVAAGIVLGYLSGMKAGKGAGMAAKAPKGNDQRIISVTPDAQKLYHRLSMTLAAVDAQLPLPEEKPAGDAEEGAEAGEGEPLSAEEISFYSELLELIYADSDRRTAGEMLSGVRYHLHLRGVELEEYDESNARHFDLMPSSESGTLRPAMTAGGKLLMRGLAAM